MGGTIDLTIVMVALTRTAIGASVWLMPIAAGKLFGMDVPKDVIV